jgi:hypothetical protein
MENAALADAGNSQAKINVQAHILECILLRGKYTAV